MFQDNNYSHYWLKHNKYYIHRHLKFINNKDNLNNIKQINPINSYLSNVKGKNNYLTKNNRNKVNNTLNSEQRSEAKVNINYIKKLLHEELQNTKSDEEDEINERNI